MIQSSMCVKPALCMFAALRREKQMQLSTLGPTHSTSSGNSIRKSLQRVFLHFSSLSMRSQIPTGNLYHTHTLHTTYTLISCFSFTSSGMLNPSLKADIMLRENHTIHPKVWTNYITTFLLILKPGCRLLISCFFTLMENVHFFQEAKQAISPLYMEAGLYGGVISRRSPHHSRLLERTCLWDIVQLCQTQRDSFLIEIVLFKKLTCN